MVCPHAARNAQKVSLSSPYSGSNDHSVADTQQTTTQDRLQCNSSVLAHSDVASRLPVEKELGTYALLHRGCGCPRHNSLEPLARLPKGPPEVVAPSRDPARGRTRLGRVNQDHADQPARCARL